MKTKTEEIFDLSCPYANEFQGKSARYLFVCSAGLLRSPTAAAVATSLGYNARSCGSEDYALIPLSLNLISWADKIFFVNEFNYIMALDTFKKDYLAIMELKNKAVVWDIEDIYNYGDFTLKEKLKELLS